MMIVKDDGIVLWVWDSHHRRDIVVLMDSTTAVDFVTGLVRNEFPNMILKHRSGGCSG